MQWTKQDDLKCPQPKKKKGFPDYSFKEGESLVMNVIASLELIAAQAEKNADQSFHDDYLGQDDLLYCGMCHTRKQHKIHRPLHKQEIIVHVLCQCEKEHREKEETKRALREKQEQIRRMKGTCIHERALLE